MESTKQPDEYATLRVIIERFRAERGRQRLLDDVINEAVRIAKRLKSARKTPPTARAVMAALERQFPQIHRCPARCGNFVLRGPATRCCSDKCRRLKEWAGDRARPRGAYQATRRRAKRIERLQLLIRACGGPSQAPIPSPLPRALRKTYEELAEHARRAGNAAGERL